MLDGTSYFKSFPDELPISVDARQDENASPIPVLSKLLEILEQEFKEILRNRAVQSR